MIKFRSYTGAYPNLCRGVLTVEIDGKEYTFGYNNADFDDFWESGGSIHHNEDWDMSAGHGAWGLSHYNWSKTDENHPQWVIDILPDLIKIFNENVPYGCCGGCI